MSGDLSIYGALLRTTIYLSDGIAKSLTLTQQKEIITVKSDRGVLHLKDDNGELQLYVPRDEDSRDSCFLRQLPRRLLAYFAINDPAAEGTLISIINCNSVITLNNILRDDGVIEVDGVHQILGPAAAYSASGFDSDQQHSVGSVSSESHSLTPLSSPSSTYVGIELQSVESQSPQSTYSTTMTTPNSTPEKVDRAVANLNTAVENLNPNDQTFSSGKLLPSPRIGSRYRPAPVAQQLQENPYAAILDRVINSAAVISLPAYGLSVSAAISDDHSSRTTGIFAAQTTKRNCLVGAAGELLVSSRSTF